MVSRFNERPLLNVTYIQWPFESYGNDIYTLISGCMVSRFNDKYQSWSHGNDIYTLISGCMVSRFNERPLLNVMYTHWPFESYGNDIYTLISGCMVSRFNDKYQSWYTILYNLHGCNVFHCAVYVLLFFVARRIICNFPGRINKYV